MKTTLLENKDVLTLDEFRVRHLSVPRPQSTTDADDFLVRPPATPQVLVIKKPATSKSAKKPNAPAL